MVTEFVNPIWDSRDGHYQARTWRRFVFDRLEIRQRRKEQQHADTPTRHSALLLPWALLVGDQIRTGTRGIHMFEDLLVAVDFV